MNEITWIIYVSGWSSENIIKIDVHLYIYKAYIGFIYLKIEFLEWIL
jgi:hypothetical protein